MSILAIGSMALDSLKCPGGEAEDVVGGSVTYFSLAAGLFAPVSVVAVVGEDFPADVFDVLHSRNVDTSGISVKPGKTFRWKGRYGDDLNVAVTENTDLGVFADFEPEVPEKDRSKQFLFLGNIDPVLQSGVIDQVDNPRFIALDTMNFWIDGKPDELAEAIAKIDCLIVNDAEARMLTGEDNLVKAARAITDMGPEYALVKKGEHGALLMGRDFYFVLPGFPLEYVADPTGAGDSFAGGFVGYLAKSGDVSPSNLCRAVAYGTTVASFVVEGVSIDRLTEITMDDIEGRLEQLGEMTSF
ncbi:MAG: sugar kinase [bacterium]|nr:sugar kinase [bacterium]